MCLREPSERRHRPRTGARRVHHRGVEPGVEPTERLVERVGLVQEQGDGNAGPSATRGRARPSASIPPPSSQGRSTSRQPKPRITGDRSASAASTTASSECRPTPRSSRARSRARERRQAARHRDEGHARASEESVGLVAREQPGGAAEGVHAEAPITLASSTQRPQRPALEQAEDRPAAKASPAPDGSTASTRGAGNSNAPRSSRRPEPASPRVTTTVPAPSLERRSAWRRGSLSPVSARASSSFETK